MKLLIFGANGWIGTQFTQYLDSQNVSYMKSQNRAEDTLTVDHELAIGNYTHVLSMIGRTSGVYNGEHINTIDFLEKPGNLDLNIRDNLFSPLTLALLCKKYDIHYTYLGTGCIFEYDDVHTPGENGWKENDLPNFKGSGYSTVKGYTDRLMHLFNNVLNLRIRMPITAEMNPRNFITKITRYERVCSIPNSMTVLPDFYPIWLDMMKKSHTGTFNCTNPGVITHNEILEMYKKYVNPDFTWKNFTIEEQSKILAAGRSNNYLDTTKLEQEYPEITDIKSSVERILQRGKYI